MKELKFDFLVLFCEYWIMNQNGKYVTSQAKKLQEALESRGVKVEREHSDGHKHIDIFLSEARMAIEVDGLQHVSDPEQIITDFQREHYSGLNNIDTLHLANSVIDNHLEEIANAITEVVRKRREQKIIKTLMTFEKV
ncbi:MAG: DUF559 domain-containing protein [Patescibacteria group bacterium]|jgi:very-short-patch-repair endonuclease